MLLRVARRPRLLSPARWFCSGGDWGCDYVPASAAQREAWKAEYQQHGAIVVPDALPADDVERLKAEAARVARGVYGGIAGLKEHADDTPDEEVIANYLAFHHPHKVSPALKAAMRHPAIVDVLTSVVSPNVKSMQSMMFVKAPGKPGQAWHQDEAYIPTRDRSLIGAWIAMDDATVDNGCLWIHRGSHTPGVLYPMALHSDPRFDPAGEAHSFPHGAEGGDAVELTAGSVVFFNGYTLHRSLPNVSERFRRAFVVHYMSAESLLPWDCDGTVEATADNRDIIMVAGIDPYAAKGVRTDLTHPFVRPDVGTVQTGDATRGAAAVASS